MWCNGASMGVWGWAMMVLVWGGIGALVIWAVRSSGGGRAGIADALRTLDQRLASGEIAPAEYEETRRVLGARR